MPTPVAASIPWGRAVLVLLGVAVVCTILQPGVAQALPPVASFSIDLEAPLTHESVTLTSTSVAVEPDRSIVEGVWDLDDDGEFDDAAGPTAAWTFTRPGPHRVSLHVADSGGERDTKSTRIVVGNRSPVPSVVLVPSAPVPNEKVTLLSSSYDPDGFITGYGWDLDGDGSFDDRTGSSISLSFAGGRHTIGLRVTDDSGGSGSTIVEIAVGDGPGGSGIRSAVRLISPFPVVRVSGIREGGGTRLRLLSVSAPIGAAVGVRCDGRGCPFKTRSWTVRGSSRSAARIAPATGLVRVRSFRRRLLRGGASVRVFVTRPGEIGKYTRLRIRRRNFPARVDRCVTPVNLAPLPCPTG